MDFSDFFDIGLLDKMWAEKAVEVVTKNSGDKTVSNEEGKEVKERLSDNAVDLWASVVKKEEGNKPWTKCLRDLAETSKEVQKKSHWGSFSMDFSDVFDIGLLDKIWAEKAVEVMKKNSGDKTVSNEDEGREVKERLSENALDLWASVVKKEEGNKPWTKCLRDLAGIVDPFVRMDDDVESTLKRLTTSLTEELFEEACMLAAHRGSKVVERQDVSFALQRRSRVDESESYGGRPIVNRVKGYQQLLNHTIAKF